MEFLIFVPCIRYENNILVYSERELSDISDTEYFNYQEEFEFFNNNKKNNAIIEITTNNHKNSISNSSGISSNIIEKR